MIFACITEGGPDCWVVEICTDLWDSIARKLVLGSYDDACIVGSKMINEWKWMEG